MAEDRRGRFSQASRRRRVAQLRGDEMSLAPGRPDRCHRLVTAGLVASRYRNVNPGRGEGVAVARPMPLWRR